MSSVIVRGNRYKIGQGRLEPLPLPPWWPTVLPAGWEEVDTSPFTGQPDRDYCRAYVKHGTLNIIVTGARYEDGKAWLHLSISRKNRQSPTWDAMCEVKDLFLGLERTALQIHPPRSKHVSIHPGCLHLWCCLDGDGLPDFTCGGETI